MKVYGTHRLIICIFHPCGNFPTRLVKAINDSPHSPKGIVLVPDDTVHKGTSKRHKTDEKITNFVVHAPPSIFDFFN